MINNVLIVCVGNICRSPMAEALMRKSLPGCRISSAGLGALIGHPADPIAIGLMRERDMDISFHRARQVDNIMVAEADLVLVMETDQQRHLEWQFPLVRGKVFLICENTRTDVPDPYGQGRDAFEAALGLITQGVDAWVGRIQSFDTGAQHVPGH